MPRAPLCFVGRAAELERLVDAPGLWVVDGMAGVGKTTLAVRAARALAPVCPDGRIFLHLHGHTSGRGPLDPGTALEALLRALGLGADRIPQDRDERAALWRSELARRRLAVVLDDAADTAQIRPLLPGSGRSAVLVTSRRRLTGLDGVRTLSLDVLSRTETDELFAGLTGAERVAAEPEDCALVAELCGHLPLAVRIAAARLQHRPAWTFGRLAERLRDAGRRLGELEADDGGVAAALALSAHQLDEARLRFFALLGLAPGCDVDAHLAAALADIDLAEAERLLDGLVDVHLIEEPAPGAFRLHALTRDFARGEHVPDGEAARARMIDYYTAYATRAAFLLDAHQARSAGFTEPEPAPRHVPVLADRSEAAAWFDEQIGTIFHLAADALAHGWPERTVALVRRLNRFFIILGRTDEWIEMSELGLAAARRTGNRDDQAWALLAQSAAHRRRGDVQRAVACLREADRIAQAGPRVTDAGYILNALAVTHADLWRLAEAADYFARAIEIFQSEGRTRGLGIAMTNLADILLRQGRIDEAVAQGEAGLAIMEADGNETAGIGTGSTIVGDAHHERGDYASALAHHRRALEIAENLDFQELFADAHTGVGNARRAVGDVEAALRHHEEAVRVLDKIGDHPSRADILNSLARTLLDAGRPEAAGKAAADALEAARGSGNPYEQARALETTAALCEAGEPGSAARYREQAEALLLRHGLPPNRHLSQDVTAAGPSA